MVRPKSEFSEKAIKRYYVIPISLLLQRVLSVRQIRVNMEAFASITESTDAVARIIILEKPAHVSVIIVVYNYEILISKSRKFGGCQLL